MKVYQLLVTGTDDAFVGGKRTYRSRILFRTKSKAEAYFPLWLARLEREDHKALFRMDYTIAVKTFLELEVEDENATFWDSEETACLTKD